MDVNDCYWRALWEPGTRGTGEEPPREPEFQPTIRPEQQPAAVAPRLSEWNGIIVHGDSSDIVNERDDVLLVVYGSDHHRDARRLFALHEELDVTRADLARARAEAAALREGIRRYMVDDPPCATDCASLDGYDRGPCDCGVQAFIDKALAAPQSEPPQPAAPVDRSAEAEGPETVRCHVCDVEIAAICDDCLKLVHDRMHELLDDTSPDHQAASEEHTIAGSLGAQFLAESYEAGNPIVIHALGITIQKPAAVPPSDQPQATGDEPDGAV